MTISANSGPQYLFGQAPGTAADYNPHRGPSLVDQSWGLMDPRAPFTYQPGGADIYAHGWLGTTRIPVVDAVPATAAVGSISAAAHAVGGTPVALVSASGAGVTIAQSVVNATTGQTVTGLLALGGGASGVVAFGQSGGTNIWDPTKALARAVGITAAAAASGTVVFTVKGYDIYGYPMTENITAAANVQTAGKKAWKFIASVTPATSDPQNYSVDTLDVYGLPLLAGSYAYLEVFFGNPATPANNLITAATGFVTADVTNPATATTGDVRGTITATSDGTKRLTVFVTPSVANIGTYTSGYPSGLVGMMQV